jgi:hypothetical protein
MFVAAGVLMMSSPLKFCVLAVSCFSLADFSFIFMAEFEI